jgi:peptidyl-prolyl cis-trans isomerase C
MLIKLRAIPIITATILALAACSNKEANHSPTTPAKITTTNEDVAATVNGMTITKNEVDLILKQQRGMPDTPETRKMIIDNIAMRLLVAHEAAKKGLDKKPETINEIEMAKQSVLAQAYVQDFIKNNEVTEAQLAAEYDKLKAQASGDQYKARHILVKTEDEAKAIIAKLSKDVKSFDSLAKAQSLDPGSKVKGGDLGWFDGQSMVPEFSAATAKLGKGKFTEAPVKTQFGYHVIILDDKRPNTKSLPPMDQVKAGLTQQLQQQNLKKMLDDVKANAKIDIVAPQPAPAKAPTILPEPTAPGASATEEPAKK